jgi:serine/threonine protein kinase
MVVHTHAYSQHRYNKIKELGCGATGSVDSVEDNVNKLPGQHYALKRLNKSDSTLWRQEFQLLRALKHPNVLEYIDAFEE